MFASCESQILQNI